MAEKELHFVPPPEAPVYEPTEEEFADPLAYIAKIRPEAEQCGICKIRPPPDWQPPFAVDVDSFKFVPRVQRLNELEARTRIKLNFLDSIAKFWELQGCRLRLPYVNGKSLDLFNLNRIVKNLGGFEVICRDKKWTKVATELGYPPGKNIGHQLGKHYERILWPYDVFQSGIPLEEPLQPLPDGDTKEKDYEPHGIISRQAIRCNQSGYSRRSKRQAPEGLSVDITNNSELKKLQLYGPGPKFQGLGLVVDTKKDKTVPQALHSHPSSPPEGILEGDRQKSETNSDHSPKKDSKQSPQKSPGAGSSMQMRQRANTFCSLIETYMCHMCGKGDAEECLLLCDGCDDSFHTFCLLPPLPEVPKGDWRCPKCLAVACNKEKDPFGFEQAGKEFTLESFGKMADQFKKDYFDMPVHMVPPEQVEKEFWRLVTTIDEDVAVHYGADIHSLNQGSGFPTKNTKNLAPEDEEYVHSGWNLNNLAILDASVLHHINVDISGMKVPWMYVGMCFSAFCWHNEDHWSYSINYLHWGEPKTWYGVSGHDADLFENTMKQQAPELFAAQPDLLHQLVTIMSPTVLMQKNVPIHRTNQCAGEFVITFPRSYHAGFNQGYNFAEAVNFCPVDWLPWGSQAIEDYRRLHRFCVFSHEELIAKMAANPENLDLNLAAAVHKELLNMVEVESKLRKRLLEMGTTKAEREAFELLPDDERQCDHCKTTCFLSACTCPCTPNKLVCIHHIHKLCDCHPSNYCLRYRYTLDELPAMLHRLKMRAESFDNWANKVRSALNSTDAKLDISELKDMLEEADEKNFPENDSLQELITAIAEAEKCSMIATQLINKKQKSMSGDEKFITRINLEELKGFVETVDGLPCSIKEATQLEDFLGDIESFITEAQDALEDTVPDSEKLQMLLHKGKSFDIELPEIPKLKQELIQARWLDEVRITLSNAGNVTLELLRKLIDSGVNLAPHAAIEKAMTELQELLSVSERWEEKAKICLNAKPPHLMALVEALIGESENIPARLPNTMTLKEALIKAKQWSSDVEELQNGDHFPYLDLLELMVSKGRSIPIRLVGWDGVEAQVTATRTWRDRAARTFLKKNTTFTLIEVLTPRQDVGMQFKGKVNRKKSIFGDLIEEPMTERGRDPAFFLATYKKATELETTSMRLLRDRNHLKQRAEEEGTSEPPGGRFCICRKPVAGHMLRCELCQDWFHTLCVPIPRSAIRQAAKPTNPLSAAALAGQQGLQGPQVKEAKFLCPLCMRSRRPKLETILSLLVSLQKLPVRLPEGESLQCLTERAMNWQDKAKQILATPEVTSAFAQLAFMVDKGETQETQQPPPPPPVKEKYIELSKADLEGIYADHDPKRLLSSKSSSVFKDLPPSTILDEFDMDSDDKLVMDISPTRDAGLNEHAYSTMSRGTGPAHPPTKKQSRKSPHVPRAGSVKVELSPVTKARLEELLIEGDLLEVSLEETQHLFRILKASEPVPVATKMMEHFISHLTEEAYEKMMKVKSEHKQKRTKRKLSHLQSESGGATGGGTQGSLSGSGGVPETKKKKKKKDKERSEEVKPEGGKKKASKKEKAEPKLVMIKKEKEEPLIVVDGDEDDDEICSAKRCLQPAGDDINWVQCDKCEKWYHLLCIGMTSQPSEDEEYVCKVCVKRKAAQKAKQKQRAKLAAQKAATSSPGKVKVETAGTESAPHTPVKDEKPGDGLKPVALIKVEKEGVDDKSSAGAAGQSGVVETRLEQQLAGTETNITARPEPMETDTSVDLIDVGTTQQRDPSLVPQAGKAAAVPLAKIVPSLAESMETDRPEKRLESKPPMSTDTAMNAGPAASPAPVDVMEVDDVKVGSAETTGDIKTSLAVEPDIIPAISQVETVRIDTSVADGTVVESVVERSSRETMGVDRVESVSSVAEPMVTESGVSITDGASESMESRASTDSVPQTLEPVGVSETAAALGVQEPSRPDPVETNISVSGGETVRDLSPPTMLADIGGSDTRLADIGDVQEKVETTKRDEDRKEEGELTASGDAARTVTSSVVSVEAPKEVLASTRGAQQQPERTLEPVSGGIEGHAMSAQQSGPSEASPVAGERGVETSLSGNATAPVSVQELAGGDTVPPDGTTAPHVERGEDVQVGEPSVDQAAPVSGTLGRDGPTQSAVTQHPSPALATVSQTVPSQEGVVMGPGVDAGGTSKGQHHLVEKRTEDASL